jgi:hypothetical protein
MYAFSDCGTLSPTATLTSIRDSAENFYLQYSNHNVQPFSVSRPLALLPSLKTLSACSDLSGLLWEDLTRYHVKYVFCREYYHNVNNIEGAFIGQPIESHKSVAKSHEIRRGYVST